ncbi:MAG: GNAT family N-acetyltransferase [Legionellaceae bacterium]|nr:GNAT family N-acetyltransferase [Legionellaceae bacterium]
MDIRKATVDDAVYLVALLAQMGYTWTESSMRERIERFDACRDNHMMVIEKEGAVVAAVAFGYFELLRLPGCACHIDTLVVDEVYRGQGLGKQLIALVEAHARSNGAQAIELISANHRKKDGTHAFYEALNYKNHQHLDLAYFAKEDLK